jgi:hypothetical protein
VFANDEASSLNTGGLLKKKSKYLSVVDAIFACKSTTSASNLSPPHTSFGNSGAQVSTKLFRSVKRSNSRIQTVLWFGLATFVSHTAITRSRRLSFDCRVYGSS